MSLSFINTPDAPAPGGHYSQAAVADSLIFTAGQVGLNPTTGETPSDFREEVRQAISNLRAVLNADGLGLEHVARTMCLLTNIDDFAVFNEEYSEAFGQHRPARSTFGIALAGGFRVEIEAIAVRQHA